jgi:iron complex transport system substrate-binding protein
VEIPRGLWSPSSNDQFRSRDDDYIKFSFKDYLRGFARLMNREEVAEEIIVNYQNRIAEVKKQLGDRLKNAEISALIYGLGGGDVFTIPILNDIWFQILGDLGIKIKPIFSMSQGYLENGTISIEKIDDYDSDILFIFNTFGKSGNSHSKSGDFLLEKPLIASLNAVKNGRAYVIGGQDV